MTGDNEEKYRISQEGFPGKRGNGKDGKTPVRVAGIGAWHVHAKDFTSRVVNSGNAVMAAVWAETPEEGRMWAEECGCRYEESPDRIFSDPSIDAVLITCATTMHFEMILRAAEAGKHVYVEKPPFADAAQAHAAYEIIKKSGICFMVGSPIIKPMHLLTRRLIEEGRLGRVVHARYRTVHELGLLGTQRETFYRREENGGGAMMDMGNHALHLMHWFFGMPEKAAAFLTSYMPKAAESGVDDNDTAVLAYSSGVTATIETGWVTPWYQYGFDLYGTKGCVSCRAYEMFVCLEDEGFQWRKVSDNDLPEPQEYPLTYWLSCIQEGRNIGWDGIETARDMMRMSDMVLEAAKLPPEPAPSLPSGPVSVPAGDEFLLPPDWIREIAGVDIGETLAVRIHRSSTDHSRDEERLLREAEFLTGKPLIGLKTLTAGDSRIVLGLHRDSRLSVTELIRGLPEANNGADICGTQGWIRVRGNGISMTRTPAGDRNAVWTRCR